MKKGLILFFLLFSILVFAQDGTVFMPFRKTAPKRDPFQRAVEGEKRDISKNREIIERLQEFVALREDDLSVFNGDPAGEYQLTLRYIAEDRCGDIKNPQDKEMCQAANSNGCSALGVVDQPLCSGFASGRFDSTFDESFSASVRRKFGDDPGPEGIALAKAIYGGFKNYTRVGCERYVKDSPFPDSVLCEVVFSPTQAQESVDQIITDLAILSVSKREKNLDACSLIKTGNIRSACRDKRYKSLNDFVNP